MNVADPVPLETNSPEAAYARQLQALLPPGPAWSTEEAEPQRQLFNALAAELARIDGRAQQLIEEADPRTTTECFSDWERIAGLPEPCVVATVAQRGNPLTLAQRRAALIAQLTVAGRQSLHYFRWRVRLLGYANPRIREFYPHTVANTVDASLSDAAWQHTWRIEVPLHTAFEHTTNGTVNEPLAHWGDALLECTLNRLKPAHTTLLFGYRQE